MFGKICFLIFILSSSYLFSQAWDKDITLDLIHPRYEDGVLMTEEGGVLCGENLRVQAKTICYTRRIENDPSVFNIFASGDLLIDYCDQVIVGDCISYDFIAKEGCITNGKTAIAPWYIGGEKFLIKENGDFIIENGYITSSEGGENDLILTASTIVLTPDRQLSAKGIQFLVKDVPIFFLPYLALDVKSTPRSPFSFTAGWGGYLGPYLSLRYHFLSWRNWDFFLRADGYMGKGVGAGLETVYESSVRDETLYTRNYYAHDISIDDPEKKNRYRFQGSYDYVSDDQLAWTSLIYDVLSDDEMANDFPPYKFELGTAGKTELVLHREEDFWIANFATKVRVNSFQSVNQELPSFEMSIHPFEVYDTGIIAQNLLRTGYYSYVFSDNVIHAKDFNALRLEVQPKFYRPSYFGPLRVTPEAGFIGIAYNDSPSREAVGQALGDFNVLVDTELSRCFGEVRHVVQPYLHYHFYTTPRVPVDSYYVFSIKDGYNHLNMIRFGTKNAFYIQPFYSHLFIDIWANAFANTQHTFPQSIPKGYIDIEYEPNPFIFIEINAAWNFAHREIDYYNTKIDWTISENLALGVEYRHRGPYDWRKADFYDFVLEASRTEDELLASPLSDRRDIASARVAYRFHPNWDTAIQYRYGWNRKQQPPFTEYRFEIGKVIFQHYHIRFHYEKREADNRYWVSFKLNPSPPR